VSDLLAGPQEVLFEATTFLPSPMPPRRHVPRLPPWVTVDRAPAPCSAGPALPRRSGRPSSARSGLPRYGCPGDPRPCTTLPNPQWPQRQRAPSRAPGARAAGARLRGAAPCQRARGHRQHRDPGRGPACARRPQRARCRWASRPPTWPGQRAGGSTRTRRAAPGWYRATGPRASPRRPKAYARGAGPAKRAVSGCALRTPPPQRGRGGSKVPLPGEVGGGQSLRHVRHQKAYAQVARLWPAA
jgi:hypothetical protein